MSADRARRLAALGLAALLGAPWGVWGLGETVARMWPAPLALGPPPAVEICPRPARAVRAFRKELGACLDAPDGAAGLGGGFAPSPGALGVGLPEAARDLGEDAPQALSSAARDFARAERAWRRDPASPAPGLTFLRVATRLSRDDSGPGSALRRRALANGSGAALTSLVGRCVEKRRSAAGAGAEDLVRCYARLGRPASEIPEALDRAVRRGRVPFNLADAIALAELAVAEVAGRCEDAGTWSMSDPVLADCAPIHAAAALAWARAFQYLGPCHAGAEAARARIRALASALGNRRPRGDRLGALATALHFELSLELEPAEARAQTLADLPSPEPTCTTGRTRALVRRHGPAACRALRTTLLDAPAPKAAQIAEQLRAGDGSGEPASALTRHCRKTRDAARDLRTDIEAAAGRRAASIRRHSARLGWAASLGAAALFVVAVLWNVWVGVRFLRQ
jgi:hypothetical protein